LLLVNRLKTNIFFVNVPLKWLSPEAFFRPKCTKYRLAAAGLRPDPLGELTALPQTSPAEFEWSTSKAKGKYEREGRGQKGWEMGERVGKWGE